MMYQDDQRPSSDRARTTVKLEDALGVKTPDMAARRVAYARALETAVDDIVVSLSCRDDVERAVIFGSYARGRRDLFTDLDILVVVRSSQDFVTRTAEMYRYLSSPVDLDLLVYTPEEFRRRGDWGFIRQALATGKVIYEKTAA